MKNSVAIESLRAWMAWWVVFGHAAHLSGASQFLNAYLYKILNSAGTAVDVFIVVSGFVITNLLLIKKEKYTRYITRRAFRIYPIYIFSIAISILTIEFYSAAYGGGPWVVGYDMRMERIAAQSERFWEHLFLHLTMLHGILPDTLMPFSGTAFLAPAWSLSLEWQFYLLAPLLIALLYGRINVMLATTAFLLVLHVAFRSGHLGIWLYKPFLPLAIQYFLIGIFSRLALEYRPLTRMPPELLLVTGATAAIFASKPAMLIWVTFFTIVLYEQGFVARGSKPFALFARLVALNPFVSTVGKWSYSTYLIHIPIFSIVVGGTIMLFGPQSQTAYVVLLVVCMPLVFLASKYLYRFIEVPFIDLGRRITSQAPPAAGLPAVSDERGALASAEQPVISR